MKLSRKISAQFAPETRFELAPVPRGSGRLAFTNDLEQLRKRLSQQQLLSCPDTRTAQYIRRAADDAASLAWSTAHPLLFLPVLLEEKCAQARVQAERQQTVEERSENYISLAA